MKPPDHRNRESPPTPVDVVSFGMLCSCYLLVVDAPPVHNAGVKIKEAVESYGDDAAVVASLLADWGVSAGFIGTTLGDDDAGRKVAQQISESDVQAEIRVSKGISTELEVSIVDPGGARTYLQQRNPRVLQSLAGVDLAMLRQARVLYVDWYDGDYILRPMRQARQLGLAVYLNLESRFRDAPLLERLAPYATLCQVSTDEPGARGSPEEIARILLEAGIETAIVTGGSRGCLVARSGETVQVSPPNMNIVDGHGAGAVFAAAFIYAGLRGWPLDKIARFATAAASLKCTVVGYAAFPIKEVLDLAARLVVC